jgi:hypothetical protein
LVRRSSLWLPPCAAHLPLEAEFFRLGGDLEQADFDLSDWGLGKLEATRAATNPKYCYNWSFEQPGECVAVCIWHPEITDDGTHLVVSNNVRTEPVSNNAVSLHVWKRRAAMVDRHVQTAYLNRLPVRAIVLQGRRRNRLDPVSKASRVRARLLDPVSWAVTEYDFNSGDFVLTRGMKPGVPLAGPIDLEVASFKEGEMRRAFRVHRHRELRARKEKIRSVLRTKGKLVCEVPKCGFDFQRRYGDLGAGYAQVHHLVPLGSAPRQGTSTRLSDLAIVCPNCHAMIHLGGKCRPLAGLIRR